MNPSIGAISKWKYLLILKLQCLCNPISLIFNIPILNSFTSKSPSFKYQRFPPSGCKKLGLWQFLCKNYIWSEKLKGFFPGLKNFINTYIKVYLCLALLGSLYSVEPEIWHTSTSSLLLWVHGEGFLTYLFLILILTKFISSMIFAANFDISVFLANFEKE